MEGLGIDVDAQTWVGSGGPGGAIEIAVVGSGEWVLMRVAGDPAQRVLVYDRFEWDCFLDGVKNGEFDDAAELFASTATCQRRYLPARLLANTVTC